MFNALRNFFHQKSKCILVITDLIASCCFSALFNCSSVHNVISLRQSPSGRCEGSFQTGCALMRSDFAPATLATLCCYIVLHATCYRRHWSAEIAVLHGTGLCAASPHQAIITTLHQVFSAVPSKMTKDDKMQHQLYVPFSQITLQIQRSAEFARLSFSAHSLLVFHICFVRNTKPFLESSQP